ncbi:MAG: RNase adapter RapZ, partial [Oscillospiraceae bacterium]
MECLILTGLSGAGKSTAIHILEDLGYYCADNIPAQLIEVFFKLCETVGEKGGKFAAVVDVRGFSAFSCDAQQLRERLKRISPRPKILYIDASDEVILNRYKGSRRRHPVIDSTITDLMCAVQYERDTLSGLRLIADYIIDTSNLPLKDFRDRISELTNASKDSLALHICSFGFKNG